MMNGNSNTAVSSVWCRHDIEKSTCRTNRYFVDFKSQNHVEIITLNRCHNFHVQLLFKIDEISTNFPCRISTSNRWRIDEDVSIGMRKVKGTKGKVEPSKQFPQRGKTNISGKSSSLVVKHSILKGLIINLDQTPLPCVTPSKYTFDVLSAKTVPVKGTDDKG